ncbi:MAG: DUF192 domain-containing protein [Actinomycetota bacterium]|nr:DUF192 domain-containing protein [Actinomycetota bacterium]
MAWLLRQGEVLASLEVGLPGRWRRRVLRREQGVGALLVTARRSTHTFGARSALDIAYLDVDLIVVSTCRMPPNRVGLPRRRAYAILQAEAGAFDRWRLRPGDKLEIEE